MKGSVKQLMNIFLAVFVLFIWVLPSPAQQVFYIYRNDGIIHTFFTANIDSMTCSTMDVDSIEHGEFVVQEVYTSDSVYRIPMETIDSVSFVTPETKYRPGVKVLEGDLKEYIVSRDSLTLLFRMDTPVGVLPVVGDKLVSTVSDDVLGGAFVGQVERVVPQDNGIEVICVPVDLMEVFEYYYGIMKKEKDPESQVQVKGLDDGIYETGLQRFSPGKLSYDLFNNHGFELSYEVDNNLSFTISKTQATISVTPIVDYYVCTIVNKDYGVNLSVTAVGNYTMEELLALGGSVNYGSDITLLETAIHIPEALIDIYFEFGVFYNMAAKISLDQSLKQKYRHVFHWEWNSKGYKNLKETNRWIPLSNTYEGKIALEGEWSIGAYGKVGVAFIATPSLDIAEVGLRVDGGLSCEGIYVPIKSDFDHARTSTELYNKLKDTEFSTYWYYGLSAEAKLFKWSVSHEIPNFLNIPLNRKERIASVRSVPEFSATKLKWAGDGVYSATAKVTGNVSKTDVGFALINQKNGADATYTYSAWGYQGGQADLSAMFYNKSRTSDYTLYPLVKYMGMELIAEPFAMDEDIPEVKTLPASFVTESSAMLEALIIKTDPLASCRYGFFYSTSSVPSVGGQEIMVGSNGDDNYTYSLSGLKDNTTYYYCAYLLVDGHYTYGEVRQFTTKKAATVRTTDASSVTASTAVLSGIVSGLSGSSSDCSYGFFYGTGQIPSVDGQEVRVGTSHEGSYTCSLSGLTENTTYYFCAYLLIDGQYRYGDVLSFRTNGSNSVQTLEARTITETSAVLSGSVSGISDSSSDCRYGFFYGTTTTPYSGGQNIQVGSNQDGNFSYSLSGLTENTTYYYCAYLLVDGKYTYGVVRTFTTAKSYSIQTLKAINVKESSVVLSGSVSGISGSSSNCQYGFYYGIGSKPYENGQSVHVGSNTDGNYTYSLTGLKDNTTYYYCAYLSVDGAYFYGEVQSFTTEKKKDEITPGQMVDLGLSVKWASWNVGASCPEETGGYYTWGELHEKSDYTMDTDQYYDQINNEWIFIGKNISGTQYDVARAQWGGNWRMPTKAEVKELVEKCTWTWTTYNGVDGQKVTGLNGNSIFLPVTGMRNGKGLEGQWTSGWYWSGTLSEFHDISVHYLYFKNGTVDCSSGTCRYYGLSIRPVSE